MIRYLQFREFTSQRMPSQPIKGLWCEVIEMKQEILIAKPKTNDAETNL